MKTVVVGGGVSGLTNAFTLARAGHEVELFERTGRLGGNLRTERSDGFTVEWGPNGFLDNVPETLDLVARLGLQSELAPSSDAARLRFLFRKGRLRPLPEGPGSFLKSPILSVPGRLRVLTEPWRGGPKAGDETVHAFAARRIGGQAADILVQSMVSGVFAGDARRLSLRATFPKMWRMERDHGSLFRAMVAKRRERKAAGEADTGGPAGPGGTLTSFRRGMETLTERLGEELGNRIRLATPVTSIRREGNGWMLEGPEVRADRVVLSCPAPEAAGILTRIAPAAAAELGRIPSAPIVVVATAFDEAEIGGAPRGFGFLVPRGENLRMLGCLWSSSIYPGDRAPKGKVLLRTMIGGALDPEAVDQSDEALLGVVRHELRTTMGIGAEPERHWIFRHRAGIPQYEPGHRDRLSRILDLLRSCSGVRLAGNSYRGVSVNAVVKEATAGRTG